MTVTFFPLYTVGVQVIEILFDVNAALFNEVALSPFNFSFFLNASFSRSSNYNPTSSRFPFSTHISYLFIRLGLNCSLRYFHSQRDIYHTFKHFLNIFYGKRLFWDILTWHYCSKFCFSRVFDNCNHDAWVHRNRT